MAVTAPIGIRPDSLEQIMMAAQERAMRERLQQRELQAQREMLAQKLASELAIKGAEQTGAATALTRYLTADPERARAFGYLVEQPPTDPERAVYEVGTQTVRPVQPGESSALLKLITEAGRGERADLRSQTQKDIEAMRSQTALERERMRAEAAMERTRAHIDAQQALRQRMDDVRLQLEQMRQSEAWKRMTYTERQKNVRATLNPEYAKLEKQRTQLILDLQDARAAAQNPELPADVRARRSQEVLVLEQLVNEANEHHRYLERLREEAGQAVELGPRTAPPEQRPGPAPTAKPQFRYDPTRPPGQRMIPVR